MRMPKTRCLKTLAMRSSRCRIDPCGVTATDSVRRVAAAVDYHNSLGATCTVADDGTVLIIRSGEERGTNLHASVEGYIG